MRQIQEGKFSLRLRVAGGSLNAGQLAKISEVANKFGKGYAHLTSRQGVEIPFVDINDIAAVKESLAEAGLMPGACGPRVRTVTACQGNSICPSGLIETTGLAKELDAKYFGQELPHKFKIGITGCRNNCLKAEENDFGIKGGVLPVYDKSACSLCGVCEAVCPAKVISIKDGEILLDKSGCLYCGKCVKSCPSDAWRGANGYIVSLGGMFGNAIEKGVTGVVPIITDKNILFAVIDAVIKYYKRFGRQGERLGKTIARTGGTALKEFIREELGYEL